MKNLFRIIQDISENYAFERPTQEVIEKLKTEMENTLQKYYKDLPNDDYIVINSNDGITNIEISQKLIEYMKIYYPEALI